MRKWAKGFWCCVRGHEAARRRDLEVFGGFVRCFHSEEEVLGAWRRLRTKDRPHWRCSCADLRIWDQMAWEEWFRKGKARPRVVPLTKKAPSSLKD